MFSKHSKSGMIEKRGKSFPIGSRMLRMCPERMSDCQHSLEVGDYPSWRINPHVDGSLGSESTEMS